MTMMFKIVSLLASAFEGVDGQFHPSATWGLVRHRHLSSPQLQRFKHRYILVRGGSVDIEDPDEGGDDDDTAQGFVSSFESELVEIRKEAERDAESEMLKLHDLIQRRGVEEDDYDYDDIGVEENSDDDEEGADIIDGNPEETVDSEEVKSLDQSNADHVNSIETSTTETSISRIGPEPGGQESQVSSDDDDERGLLFVGLDEDGKTEQSSGLKPSGSDEVELEDSEDKAKRRKKGKSKSSKKKKKRKPEYVSATTTTTLQDSGQIGAEQRKGVMFYLRSDVGRALTLFIATVILALLTKRMERQMSEQQNVVE